MKIGITLKDFYKEYLQEIANLNDVSPTTICSLIVENYLSFNKEKGRLPLFTTRVSVSYRGIDEENFEDQVDEPVKQVRLSRREMLEILAMPEEDISKFQSED